MVKGRERGASEDATVRMNMSGTPMSLGPLPLPSFAFVNDPHTPLPLTPLPLDQLVALQPRRHHKRKAAEPSSSSSGAQLSAGSLAVHNRSVSSASSSSASTSSTTNSHAGSGITLQPGEPSRRGVQQLLLVPGRQTGGKRARSLVDDGDSAGVSSDGESSVSGDAREGEWDEADDLVLQSFILHPLQPLSKPYPPGSLPSPGQLDELANQIMHYQGSTSRSPRTRARARARAASGYPFDGPAHTHGIATPPDSADSEQDDAPRWAHNWRQTRSRLAHVGRLVAKGYNAEAIARALGHAGTESEASADERMAVDSVRNDVTAADQPIGPFKVGAAISGHRKRLSRPTMRRVSSMDFLDEATAVVEESKGGLEVEMADVQGSEQAARHEVPASKEGGLGRVLRLSTTLQHSSKIAIAPQPAPLMDPMTTIVPLPTPPASDLLSPSLIPTPPTRPRTLRRRTSTKSTAGIQRPTSLLQRGRSFTASDLTQEVEALKTVADQVDVNMEDATTSEDKADEPSSYVTPVKQRPVQHLLSGGFPEAATLSPLGPFHASPDMAMPMVAITPPSPAKPTAPSTVAIRNERPLARARSSTTFAELEANPHRMQQLFIAQNQPVNAEPVQLQAPFQPAPLGKAFGEVSDVEDSGSETSTLVMRSSKKKQRTAGRSKPAAGGGMRFGPMLGDKEDEGKRLASPFGSD